jgi:hypothetical protein
VRRAATLVEVPEAARPAVIRFYALRSGRRPGFRSVTREASFYFGVGPELRDDELTTVVEETPGVRRYQVPQTAPSTVTVRLETDPGADRTEVWLGVRARLAALLQAQHAAGVALQLAKEGPQANPRSGKLRHVQSVLPGNA